MHAGVPRGQKWASDGLELEQKLSVATWVTERLGQVLCKGSKHS